MILSYPPIIIVGFLLGIIIAISVHEFAHAWIAYRLGDPTARFSGRLTLNPLAHLDPLGTLLLLLAGFGWGKPVPINTFMLRTRRNEAKVALAGPLSNFLVALIFAIPYRVAVANHLDPTQGAFLSITNIITEINLVLLVFNLIPIPPLDGSRILHAITPLNWREAVETLEIAGPFLLLGVIFFEILTNIPILQSIITPPIHGLLYLARSFPYGLW